jgi:hypothetical protein
MPNQKLIKPKNYFDFFTREYKVLAESFREELDEGLEILKFNGT